MKWAATVLGYPQLDDYLSAFTTSEGRADMADRFVTLANRYGIEVEVLYE